MSARRAPASFYGLLGLTGVLAMVRLFAATRVGFGDSEALYASYAMHPQPAYLDHPAMIALLSRFAGGGGAPSPLAAHQLTTLLAAFAPWLLALAARGSGASWHAALTAGCAFACVPEIAVGLFAMTPDLLLAITWIGALGCAALGLRLRPDDSRAAALLAGAGLLAGAACASKASGALLLAALFATYLTRPARAHAKTIWPWVGLAAGLVVTIPVLAFEARAGWPMLRHRLIDTQAGAGLSLRNLGALLGGQLAYVSPLYVVAAFLVARDLIRARARAPQRDAVDALLWMSFVVPLGALTVLALWSRVAEPHWLAPALLALPIHYARAPGRVAVVGRRLGGATIASGLVLTAAVYAWVLVPASARLLPQSVDARFDLANELYGWPSAIDAVRHVVESERHRSEGDLVVVGPHWVVCAQLHAALGAEIAVGCDTPVADDFDTWYPRALWRRTDKIVFVSDNRFFPDDVQARFPDRARTLEWQITVTRGGRTARVFTVSVFEKHAGA